MARRASSGLNPGVILGAVVVVGLVIVGGKMLFSSKPAGGFKDVPKLEIEQLLENGNSLRNNVYSVEGEIQQKIRFSSEGQLVSVRLDGVGDDKFLSIVIPNQFNNLNIETRQKYAFRIQFRDGGIAVATGINRL